MRDLVFIVEGSSEERFISRCVIPYLTGKEEFLGRMMNANMDGFNAIVDDDKQLVKLQRIVDEFGNPEDIDNGQLTAPSKRLMSIFGYEKVSDSYRALSEITIPVIRERCPRFDEWISIIENALKTDRFL